jgi:hypothetical protein
MLKLRHHSVDGRLPSHRDDATVVVRSMDGGGAMLFKTILALQDLVDYHKCENGSWKAEFRGPFEIEAEGPSLERCRHRAYDALDEKLATWLAGRADSAAPTPSER